MDSDKDPPEDFPPSNLRLPWATWVQFQLKREFSFVEEKIPGFCFIGRKMVRLKQK
jgi:hypothetical protein